MAFFDFLKDANTERKAAGKVFSFLTSAIPGVREQRMVQRKTQDIEQQASKLPEPIRQKLQPQLDEVRKGTSKIINPAETARNFAIGAGRSILRVPEQATRSVIQGGFDIGAKLSGGEKVNVDAGAPTDPLRRLLYGSEPLQTYQTRQEGNKKVVEGSRFRSVATPLAFLGTGANLFGDLTIGGGAKKEVAKEGAELIGKELVEKIAKETTQTGVQNILKSKVAPEIAKKLSGPLSVTKDPNVVQKIIQKDIPDAFTPRVIARAPKESKELSMRIKDGELMPTAQVAPVDSLRLGAGTADGHDPAIVADYVSKIKAGETIDPLVIDATGAIQDGGNRFRAMQELGVKDIPVVQQITKDVPANAVRPGSDVADAYAGELMSYDQSVKGGQMIPDGTGGYSRTTEHSPFYSEYYKEFKRPPSQAAYKEQALKELEMGRAPSHYQPFYDDAINPETQSLLARGPEAPITPEEQNALSAKQLSQDANRQAAEIRSNTPRNITSSTNEGKDLADFLTESHKTLPNGKEVSIEYQPSGTQDKIKVEGTVKSSYGGRVRNDANTMTYKGKSETTNYYKSEGRTIVTDSSGNNHIINNEDISSVTLTDNAPRKPSLEGDGKKRVFGRQKTMETSGSSTEPTKKALKEMDVREYQQKGKEGTLQWARDLVDNDPDGAMERFRTSTAFTDEEVILGDVLAQKAQLEGRTQDVIDITERTREGLLQSGRTSEAGKVWSRLTPEGLNMIASRKAAKLRNAIDDGAADAGAKDAAKELKDTVEGIARIDKGDVQDTLDKIVKDVESEELTTGQKIANKVDRAINPKKKKQADLLVAEVTKKIKQEQLAPLPKANKRSATQILQEVFGRNKEAQEAFPEAQAILRDKFANNPKALKQLDTFFNSELGLPAAGSTVNTAIKEQLKLKGTRVSEIIYESWDGQNQSVDDIAKALVKEGFDETSAKSLADEVVGRLNNQLGEAKRSVLERMVGDVAPKAQTTYVERLNKLSNLGALNDEDYLTIARSKLDLPQLTTETSEQLSSLSQKLQGLADNDPERYKVIKEIGEVIQQVAPPEKPSIWVQILGAPRSMLASFDISGMGRQGIALGTMYRKEFGKSFKSQLKNFASEEQFNNSMAKIAADPRADLMQKSGLALTGIAEYGKPEEAFASQLPEMIPLFGKGIKASDRSYTGALTEFRANVFNSIMDKLEASGVDINAMPKEHLESIGKFINTASGRGVGKAGGYFEKHANGLSLALFSPRLWKSRLDMLNPKYYYDLKGPARALAMKNAATFAGTAAAVLGLAVAAGADVETDARSSDFLKIKVGDTRFDILGGFQQNLVFAWRQISGEKKSSVTGKITNLDEGGFSGANRLSILSDLIQNKENPTLAMATTQLKGQDKAGNKMDLAARTREVAKLGVPISLLETGKAIKDEGLIGAVKNVPGFLGVGVGTYGLKDIQPTDKQKQYVKDLETNGASKDQIEATRAFYQTLKVGPDRKKISGEISEAIKAGDTAKAKQLADDYNKEYAATFKDWKKKHGEYASDKALLDAYTKGKIKLTKASVKSRARSSKSIYEATKGR